MDIDTRDVSEPARELGSTLRGDVILPGDARYDAARRVWNGMHDRRPAAIVRALGASDVVAALDFARAHDLPVAVRGGGHSVAGYGTVDDGLVIDLGPMQGLRVDPARATVRVEPGVTLGGLDRETQLHGLAVPIGVISQTGVGGLTLGGGVGWLTRTYGLSLDNLISADVVTADGRLVHTSDEQEPDLFWGLRGGGGNFGIVTSFEFRAYPLGPDVLAGTFIYRRPTWTAALRAFDAWTADLSDEMTSIVTFLTPPPGWELGDETLLLLGFVWAGLDRDAGLRALEPLRAALPPDIEVLEPTRWTAWQSAADEIFPAGVRAYWKNVSLERLEDATIEAIVEAASTLPDRRTGFDVHLMGGAVSRVPDDATAFPNRSARYWINMYATWDSAGDDEAGRGWARRSYEALRPSASTGEYVNFMGSSPGDADAATAALTAYGAAKLDRLRALKRRWDPENRFRLNHNVEPAKVDMG
jgi:FAD/FMN-containing dehydrogenase